jgi:hypothetical protein
VTACEWFRVYDIIEAIHRYLMYRDPDRAKEFEAEINAYFRETGIGWQLLNGVVQVRGAEAFESTVRRATAALAAAPRPTASREIEEALRDLSRRPEPDLTGAIQHATAALECVARDICGDPKATLGEILKRYPLILPRPLDDAVSKVWGYASEMARHLREGRIPDRDETELVVGLAAAVATYLAGKSLKKS